MALGAMRHRVTIQSQTRTSDGGGGQFVTWSDVDTVYASIKPASGSERLFGDQLEERVSTTITIRHRRDVTFKNRIKYSSTVDGQNYTRTFNIRRVINRDTRDKYLDILVEEGVAT